MKPPTACVHAGVGPEPVTGAVTTPIFATSTYAYESFGRHRGWEYSPVMITQISIVIPPTSVPGPCNGYSLMVAGDADRSCAKNDR